MRSDILNSILVNNPLHIRENLVRAGVLNEDANVDVNDLRRIIEREYPFRGDDFLNEIFSVPFNFNGESADELLGYYSAHGNEALLYSTTPIMYNIEADYLDDEDYFFQSNDKEFRFGELKISMKDLFFIALTVFLIVLSIFLIRKTK